MSWSYRSDQADSVYNREGGPALVDGDRQSSTPLDGTLGSPSVDYVADGAIAPTASLATLSKPSVAADTLAAPTANGQRLTLVSTTAFAHVVTATGLFNDGTSGSPHNLATFAAFPGATLSLQGLNGKWNVISKNGVTIS